HTGRVSISKKSRPKTGIGWKRISALGIHRKPHRRKVGIPVLRHEPLIRKDALGGDHTPAYRQWELSSGVRKGSSDSQAQHGPMDRRVERPGSSPGAARLAHPGMQNFHMGPDSDRPPQ